MPQKIERIEIESAQDPVSGTSSVWNDFAEFIRFKDEASGKYIGCIGHKLEIPGCEELVGKISDESLFIIPGFDSMWEGGDGVYWNTRAHEFARRHNSHLRQIRGE